jgi:hypothetical protein
MSDKVLVLMGNRTISEGILSIVARKRADKAIELMENDEDFNVIPTGAFGEFNTSPMPHGELIRNYLMENGIDQSRILPHTTSSNTIEDAYGVLRVVNELTKEDRKRLQIHVVTSHFHMERVKFIFGQVLQGHKLVYHALDISDDADAEKDELLYEKNKLLRTKKEWVDISSFNVKEFPESAYENLGYELRHYDNLSYLTLAGAFFSFSFLFSTTRFSECVWFMVGQYLSAVILVAIFWMIYLRLANTAASARHVMSAVEKLYGIPGISSTKLMPILGKTDDKLKIKYMISTVMIFLIIALLIKVVVLFYSDLSLHLAQGLCGP